MSHKIFQIYVIVSDLNAAAKERGRTFVVSLNNKNVPKRSFFLKQRIKLFENELQV